jgi:hypothetical protein
MRPGVSTSSVAEDATFTSIAGTWDTDYPVTGLADPIRIAEVARVTPATGAAAFKAALTADQSVDFFALAGHTLPAGATVRFRGYSDAAATLQVADTTATTIPTPVSPWRQTFPAVLSAPVTIRAVRVDIANAGADPIDIGACIVGRFWEWPWITAGMTAGLRAGGGDIDLIGGGSVGRDVTKLRTREGQISYLDLSTSSTTGLDHQKRNALTRPFVFIEDLDTPANWPRDCFLAVNSDLPASVAALFDKDTFQFRLVEHVR